jgi:MFS family permease
VLFSSILIFALGSLLCGTARVCKILKDRPLVVMFSQGLKWLIAARAVSGIGGGGIVSSVWVITSELVEVPNRAKWSQALSVTWSCSAIAGPLLGGLFSSTLFFPLSRLFSVLMESVRPNLFHFKLAMGLYVMVPFWVGSVSFLTQPPTVYLNLPICFMGALVLALSLNGVQLEGPKGASWKDFLRKFDFVGL